MPQHAQHLQTQLTGATLAVSTTGGVDVRAEVERYVAEKVALGDYSPQSAVQVASVLRRFSVGVGDIHPGELTRSHITAYLASQTGNARTQRNRLSAIRTFTAWCHANDIIGKDPAAAMKSTKVPVGESRFLEPDEVTLVLAEAKSPRDRLLILLLVQMGLRRGEAADIDIEDIDFAERLLAVHGKGYRGAVSRVVSIPVQAFEALRAFLHAEPVFSGPLLRNYRGGRISRNKVSQIVAAAMYDAGVKASPYDGRSAHALRHTMVQHLVDAGKELRDIQAFAGHASIQTTELYARRKIAVDKLRAASEGRTY